MPWGKFKGCRVSLLPDDYLCWIATSDLIQGEGEFGKESRDRWAWLRESLEAELKWRGFNVKTVEDDEPARQTTNVVIRKRRKKKVVEETPRVKRKFRFE